MYNFYKQEEINYKQIQIRSIYNQLLSKIYDNEEFINYNNNIIDKKNKVINIKELSDKAYLEAISLYESGYRITYIKKKNKPTTIGRKKTETKFLKILENDRIIYTLIQQPPLLEKICNNLNEEKKINGIIEKTFSSRNTIIWINYFYKNHLCIKQIEVEFLETTHSRSKIYSIIFTSKNKIIKEFKTFNNIIKMLDKDFIVLFLSKFIIYFY
jgi:hypothetical protein